MKLDMPTNLEYRVRQAIARANDVPVFEITTTDVRMTLIEWITTRVNELELSRARHAEVVGKAEKR